MARVCFGHLSIYMLIRTLLVSLAIFFLVACSDSEPGSGSEAGANVEVQVQVAGESAEINLQASAEYVGAATCAGCHQGEYDHWQGSHHDLAMQEASESTVLGNFDNATFDYFDSESVFYREDEKFMVRTEGSDGTLQDYEIAYTFGVEPLQQYLIPIGDGKLQALSIVWDARPEAKGGQRWYHLYPDEEITADDELHWTGLNLNWNFMCADCHSTNLEKNYSFSRDSYDTTWSEIDVACEACHGAGSNHVELAQHDALDEDNSGFALAFDELEGVVWEIDAEAGNARRSEAKESDIEINVCGRCHARRATAHPGADPEDELLDYYNVSLLEDGLYHADGQINDEVYVYGSFLQSRMYQEGVTCSNCHEPHSLELRAEGNALCGQCHLSEKYDNPEHHLHPADSVGTQCVNCHMPDETYMGVDDRRDHSFRIPRPDISMDLGTPNACNDCHQDESAEWAAGVLEEHLGPNERTHYAYALFAGRLGLPQGEALLTGLFLDEEQPSIVRATAASLLTQYFSQQTANILQIAAQETDPLIGLGLAGALNNIPEQYRNVFAIPLLYDASRVTRGLAARSMPALPDQQLPAEAAERFNQAITEYQLSEEFNADRPESLNNLAGLYSAMGQNQQAERYFQAAIERASWYTPAYVNLADHYRRLGQEDAGMDVLEQALETVRDTAPVNHALGLALVRNGQTGEAMEYLRAAAESPMTTDRYQYVYAIGLNSLGNWEQALEVLEVARQQFPGNMEILSAMISINRENGRETRATELEAQLP